MAAIATPTYTPIDEAPMVRAVLGQCLPVRAHQGHLEAAVLVPLSKLKKESDSKDFVEQLAQTLPQDKIIYCHCRSGGRALVATSILQKMGYDVRPLKAGYADLLKAGFSNGNL